LNNSMGFSLRRASAWALTYVLASGLLLPFVATPAFVDADGACGIALVPGHDVQQFEAPLPLEAEHCVLHHWWNALTSARASADVRVAPPDSPASAHAASSPQIPHVDPSDDAPPRGPPPAHA
jgi:hypothetical protein